MTNADLFSALSRCKNEDTLMIDPQLIKMTLFTSSFSNNNFPHCNIRSSYPLTGTIRYFTESLFNKDYGGCKTKNKKKNSFSTLQYIKNYSPLLWNMLTTHLRMEPRILTRCKGEKLRNQKNNQTQDISNKAT